MADSTHRIQIFALDQLRNGRKPITDNIAGLRSLAAATLPPTTTMRNRGPDRSSISTRLSMTQPHGKSSTHVVNLSIPSVHPAPVVARQRLDHDGQGDSRIFGDRFIGTANNRATRTAI